MRPKPLIPIRVATLLTPELCSTKDGYDDSVAEDIWALLDVGEHLRSQVGLGVGDAEILGALVRHRQQPADPPGDGVLGEWRVGEGAELLQRSLCVLEPQPAGRQQVLGSVVAED